MLDMESADACRVGAQILHEAVRGLTGVRDERYLQLMTLQGNLEIRAAELDPGWDRR